jgi:ergothioneine biosynthesis protein EgtB
MERTPVAAVLDTIESLRERYTRTRAQSLALTAGLQPEDTVVQSMPDVSPTKWHLAHVTWFFERFVLEPCGVDRLNDEYHYLFNSYYNSVGEMHPRTKRGEITRPTFDEVLEYRAHVDATMTTLLDSGRVGDDLLAVLELGLQHEQQHQELLLTDIKHVLAQNPLRPAARLDLREPPGVEPQALRFIDGDTGIVRIGHDRASFCFDNETPAHDALLHPHGIANRLVTNGEFREFIDAGAYEQPEHWLSDGWATIRDRGWNRPLYWDEGLQSEFTLGGVRDIDAGAPVTHVSYYEADAFARWAGCRLPTEFEWERLARNESVRGNLLGSDYWQPVATADGRQLFGDAWEWTSSAYAPYPGFRPLPGSLGEYNGKFMCNQMTVRGGSCVTADDHIRASYRSFFYPDARWQFLGFRLARDEHA